MNINEAINHPKATIVDVRSKEEFASGHVEGAINIPLNEVPRRVAEFDVMSKPLVLCCLSGGRSGQATQFLRDNGIEDVHNGGGWSQVQIHKM
jgi:phage shock protein E